ncbi:hypothetical protein PHYBLDRAFT_146259 [Phycomyces blakesleeanus NRRL 1555(-)]|uniref:SET domain-containing protein n=1 Tax=Phycomyces blakesleeanus (strain ATCC 8743b / DSM 1359 / FGSC 10004 / NBRC 33097 / NRRL 1555) TaxID=763407 RepID=A0A162U2G0_PHYB8|nr:hypothetical protein PHYBLDRAFT_146259 [Phycomyces blakesleeanus NRRL 1555(-)]OAD72942.1 hypothetical protein PHYBLDRAFT_146259 [Phycomyces blakesleeanus NRRL 1555(-)]|eukprot:XP_018290982.1 hypothetical protein PHYBLDRAFT_146259 [Phycomyces blakesleeanus NRRL 1555(-)]
MTPNTYVVDEPFRDEIALAEQKAIDNQLTSHTNPLLKVDILPGKGRGFVATSIVLPGTILHTSVPLAATVSDEWTPETCGWCFNFSYPKKMRHKALDELESREMSTKWTKENKSKKTISISQKKLLFCSKECKSAYLSHGYSREWELHIATLSLLEKETKRRAGLAAEEPDTTPEDNTIPTEFIELDDDIRVQQWIDEAWSCITQATDFISQAKLYSSGPADNTMCRLIAACLVRKQCEEASLYPDISIPSYKDLLTIQDNELSHFRIQYRASMPTHRNSIPYTKGQPVSAFLKYMPPSVLDIIRTSLFFSAALSAPGIEPRLEYSHELFRSVYFREMSNSFGIWEIPKNPSAITEEQGVTDDLELLGWGIYPMAVYFNHSCDANVIKLRRDRNMVFVARRTIQKGEEACISYGSVGEGSIKLHNSNDLQPIDIGPASSKKQSNKR